MKASKRLGSDTSILHHAFISIFIALWAVITHSVTILMPILSYFTSFTVGERSNFKKIPTHTQDHGDA